MDNRLMNDLEEVVYKLIDAKAIITESEISKSDERAVLINRQIQHIIDIIDAELAKKK